MSSSRISGALAVWLTALAVVAWPGVSVAGGGPENVAVVVNADSWNSMTIANAYLRLRGIPHTNVVYLRRLPGIKGCSVGDFRDRILIPALKELSGRKLGGQIDYIVYSADIPYAIDCGADLAEPRRSGKGPPVASVTGLTFLYQLTLSGKPVYLGLNTNYYARRYLPIPRAAPAPELNARYAEALAAMKRGNLSRAESELRRLRRKAPGWLAAEYSLARCLAKQGRSAEAIGALVRAARAGVIPLPTLERDPYLDGLRGTRAFRNFLQELRLQVIETQPPLGFRSALGWTSTGRPVPPKRGRRYLLSAMLAVVQGRGVSIGEALGCLRRSVGADGSRPPGTIYLARGPDVRSRVRDWTFPSVKFHLERLGIAAEIVDAVMPRGKPDVAGAVLGAARFDWARSGNRIRPGAFCEHVSGSGGDFEGARDGTPLTVFLRHGAAGASGAVAASEAAPAKFPTAFAQVYYAAGCSLAEAFYQSVRAPYQSLLVGDPLCRPWARAPEVVLRRFGPKPGQPHVYLIQPTVRDFAATPVNHYEVYIDGRRVAFLSPRKTYELDTRDLAAGYHTVRVVASGRSRIRTRGYARREIFVRRDGLELRVAPYPKKVEWDQAIPLSAELPGGRGIVFFLESMPIARIRGSKGAILLKARAMGMGSVRIRPVGLVEKGGKGSAVNGAPIDFEIVPPPPLPAIELAAGASLRPGLKLSFSADPSTVVETVSPPDWLAKTAGDRKEVFFLQGFFEAREPGVHVFQTRTDLKVSLVIDDEIVEDVNESGWRYLPVNLKRGWHRLLVFGSAAPPNRLRLRFGGQGIRPLGGDRFFHLN